MTINQKIKKEIVNLLKKQKINIEIEDLAVPPSPEMGDLALPCFKLAKQFKRKPEDIAADFAKNLKPTKFIINYQNFGPYLNFVFNFDSVAELVLPEILKKKNKYGQNNEGKKEKVMIEYSQPNTHKEFHVGHLRNVCLGLSLVNIYKSCGYKVIAANYIGDTGAHVAKTLWYLKNFVNRSDLDKVENKGEFLGECYVQSNKMLDEAKNFTPSLTPQEAEENVKNYKEQIADILKRLEDGDKDLKKIWLETRQWSLDQFNSIYHELGAKFDFYFYESEEEKDGKKMIPRLLKYDFIKKSQGAVIADLEKYNLGVLVLLRKDGTVLYGLKDIPLAVKKFKKYKISKSLYVIDQRQSQYFKQVFKILELMGFKKDMIHVPYEFVQLKSGIISSRTGNVVTYNEVREAALNKVVNETKKRHPDWSDKKIEKAALKIVIAALKFGMIKVRDEKIITFDIDEALDVNGFSGPYLQYTVARLHSLFQKSKKMKFPKGKIDYRALATNIEKKLIKDLIEYENTILESLKLNDPAPLAQYLFNLAQDFNTFYHELPIIKAEPKIMAARLNLVKAVNEVLNNGMELLGLPILPEM